MTGIYIVRSFDDATTPINAHWPVNHAVSIKEAACDTHGRRDASNLFVDRGFAHNNKSVGDVLMERQNWRFQVDPRECAARNLI